MDSKNLRYIVFLLNPDTAKYLSDGTRIDTHDGTVCSSLSDAKAHARKAIEDKECTRFVIGTFYLEPQAEYMFISNVETFGFKNDKKNINQLSFFNSNQ